MTPTKLRDNVLHWRASHPDWRDGEPWDRHVSSYAVDDGIRLVLIDPLDVPDDVMRLASERSPVILLTAPWHERDARTLVTELGAPVFTPRPDSAEYLMKTFGITAEQAGDGSPDVVWLRQGEGQAHWYETGDSLPIGAKVHPGHKPNDVVLWLEQAKAIAIGDTLADHGDGIQINERWLPPGVTREDVADRLRPLLDLPIELVLPAHGEPGDRAMLERALT